MARKSKRQESCVKALDRKCKRLTKSAKKWEFTFDVWVEPGSSEQQLLKAAEVVLIDVLGDHFSRLSRHFRLESVEHQKSRADPDWHIATICGSDAEARAEIEILFGADI